MVPAVPTYQGPRSVRAGFTFMDPTATSGVVDDADPRNTRLATCSHEVTVSDLRGREDSVSLQRNGLAVLHSPSSCRSYNGRQDTHLQYCPCCFHCIGVWTNRRRNDWNSMATITAIQLP